MKTNGSRIVIVVSMIMLSLSLGGCALSPTQGQLEFAALQANNLKEVQLAIILGPEKEQEQEKEKEVPKVKPNGKSKKKETRKEARKEARKEDRKKTGQASINLLRRQLPLPEPEGDGGGPTCFQLCNDDCDDQCLQECPELYAERCADDDSSFDWGHEEESQPQPDPVVGDGPPVEDEPGPVALNEASGSNNTQLNVTGNNNTVTINGADQNQSPKQSPNPSLIEQAKADLLRQSIKAPESPFKIGMDQIRGLLNDTTDNVVKVAPAVLTGLAIGTAGDVVKAGFDAAGDKNDGSFNDLSDRSVTIKQTDPVFPIETDLPVE